MKNDCKVTVTVDINADTKKVWKTITSPANIKEFLMGATVKTDWKQGSSITWSGKYENKKYEDKGIIKQIVPEKILKHTYWSSMSGEEDTPDNYKIVTYSLEDKGSTTTLTLLNENVKNEKEQKQLKENWSGVLKKIKEIAEK